MDPMLITTLATSATAFLAPYLAKAGEAAAEALGEKLPEAVGQVWNAITARFKAVGPVAEEAAKDLAAKPQVEDNQAAFRKELKKLLQAAERATGQIIILNTGSGAVAWRRARRRSHRRRCAWRHHGWRAKEELVTHARRHRLPD